MEVNSLLLVLRCCLPVAFLDNAQQTEMIGKLFRRNGGLLQEKRVRVVILNHLCLAIYSESRNFVKHYQWTTRCILLYCDICSRTII